MKLRTNLRRFFIILILIWSKPSLYSLIIGAGLAILGQMIHFIAAGYLVKKEQLTIAGPYRFCRNPFYLGNLLYDGGLCVIAHNPYLAIIYLPIFYLIVIPRRIRKEEKFLSEKYGQTYFNYCQAVPRFFPRLVPAKLPYSLGFTPSNYNVERPGFSWKRIIKYRELWRVMRALGLIIVFYLQYRIQFNIFVGTTQWQLLYAPEHIILLCLLGIILVLPPIIEYGLKTKYC